MAEFLSNIGLAGASSIVSAVIVFLICFIGIRIVCAVAEKLLNRTARLDGTIKGFIKTALRILLWALAVVIVAGSLGIPTASLVAVISVAGLALSLSVQNIMSNLFSGITLLITRPFGQGDLVDIGGNTGLVQSVGLFYTVINTLDNRVVSIPNGDATGASIVNYSREPLRRVDMSFSASYDDPTETVRDAILSAAKADDRILTGDGKAPFVALGAYKDSSVEYIVRLWCRNTDYWDVYFGMNERVREAFAEKGVTMTYNHINVHIDNK